MNEMKDLTEKIKFFIKRRIIKYKINSELITNDSVCKLGENHIYDEGYIDGCYELLEYIENKLFEGKL